MALNVVYKITKKSNNELVYIGKTNSFERRKLEHFAPSIYNNREYPLYLGIRKYGVDAYIMEKLFECKTEEEALELEKKMISEMKPRYNLAGGGEGFAISLEKRRSEKYENTHLAPTPYRLVNIKTKEVQDFDFYCEGKVFLKCTAGHLKEMLEGLRRSINGWVGSYNKDVDWDYLIKEAKRPAKTSSKKIKGINKSTGEIMIFDDSYKASDTLNLKNGSAHIRKVCNGERKSAYGYYWEYVDKEGEKV